MPLLAAAQPFAVLPDMPGLQKGTLPNGTSYYVFQNSSSKGLADFVLLQKVGTSSELPGEEGMALRTAKNFLASSERMRGRSPQEQMVLEGALPNEYGFVKVDEMSTTFWFDDIPVLGHEEKIDSALLVLFDLIDRQHRSEDSFVRRNYDPEGQAVIVSGDVDPASIVGKMRMLSLMTPFSRPEKQENIRDEQPADTLQPVAADTLVPQPVSFSSKEVVALTMVYDIERVPQEYMNTVYPAVTSKYLRKIGILAQRRLRLLLEEAALPYAGISSAYVGSTEQPENETLSLTVKVAGEDRLKALELMTAAFASMSTGRVTSDEQRYASGVFAEDLRDWAINPIVLNSVNVQRAISSFLYGGPLVSPRKEMDFLLSKSIPDSVECKLVNNFAKAVLSGPGRLSRKVLSGMTEDEQSAAIAAGWKSGLGKDEVFWQVREVCKPDSRPDVEKVKVRTHRPEPVTGGEIWTFNNGLRVIYKQMPVDKQLYASLIFNQGYASLSHLASGEGVLVNDIQKLYQVDNLSYNDYVDALLAHDVKVGCDVKNFSTSVDVRAPQDSLSLVIEVLDDMISRRSPDSAALARYSKCEPLYKASVKGTRKERIQKIDSIMCPTSIYSPYRKDGLFSADLVKRSEALFQEMSDHLNESILVLISEEEPEIVKKKLMTQVGRFKVERNLIKLPPVNFQPQAGSATYTVRGDEFCADIAISARIPLTSENYVLAQVASLILEERLIRSLSSSGVRVEVSDAFRKVPQERFNVLISLTAADEEGFVEGSVSRNLVNVLNCVRSAVKDIPAKEDVERYLPVAKALLGSRHAHLKTYPDFHVATIRTRYLEGKDLFSKYETYLNGADAEKVIRIYSVLSKGSSVEYIVETL